MAFLIGSEETKTAAATGQGGYGKGKREVVASASGTIVNRYARVTNIGATGKTITVSAATTEGFGDFSTGSEIIVHCVAYLGNKKYCGTRGKWKICRIKKAAANGVLTLDQSVSDFLKNVDNIGELVIQAITLPRFKSVTINEGTSITCLPFSAANNYGGVVAFKCNEELNLNGGHIDLANKGIPSDSSAYYWGTGWVNNEDATSSTERISAGWENFRTTKHLTINCPDGAALIITKTMNCDPSKKSRIGRPNGTGVARKRVTETNENIGGSSILIAAETINYWDSDGSLISKYPPNTNISSYRKGQARCYIATETILPTDEGLYALDRISDSTRAAEIFNLTDIQFGNGKTAREDNTLKQLNSYARVTKIDSTRTILDIDESNWKNNGIATINDGALVLIHVTKYGKNGWVAESGRCMFARILKYANKQVTIDQAFNKLDGGTGVYSLAHYFVQIIAVPEFPNWGLHVTNDATPVFSTACGGGIAVVAVKNSCNLTGGQILVEGKGYKGVPYGETGLKYIGNAQMAVKLPLGEGHGSVLILAKNLKMDSNTRIGASYSGRPLGGFNKTCNTGDPMYRYETNQSWEGGEPGRTLKEIEVEVSYIEPVTDSQGTTGGGRLAGTSPAQNANGGYGSNSAHGAAQGAHVLIIANSIDGFCIDAISTGGAGGENFSGKGTKSEGENGGASHGGGGGSCGIFSSNTKNGNTPAIYRGGNGGFIGGGGGAGYNDYISGGGSGGFAFVYCNEFVNQNSQGISLD